MNVFNYLQPIWIKLYHMTGNEFLTDSDLLGMMLRNTASVLIISCRTWVPSPSGWWRLKCEGAGLLCLLVLLSGGMLESSYQKLFNIPSPKPERKSHRVTQRTTKSLSANDTQSSWWHIRNIHWWGATLEFLPHQVCNPDTGKAVMGAITMIRISPASRESGKGTDGLWSGETFCGGD